MTKIQSVMGDIPYFNNKNITKVGMLSGGLTNEVCRLEFDDGLSVISKYYPPHTVSQPSIPISQDRYFTERRALEYVYTASTDKVKVPKIISYSDEHKIILMEDIGKDCVSLKDHLLSSGEGSDKEIVSALMEFLYRLYALPVKDELHNESAFDLLNMAIYEAFRGKYKDSKSVHIQKLLQEIKPFGAPASGGVVTMGDFWPNSVYISKGLIYIIDWEICRVNTKSADVMQMVANLWLIEGVNDYDRVSMFSRSLLKNFEQRFNSRLKRDDYNYALIYAGVFMDNSIWRISNIHEKLEELIIQTNNLLS
ncbi:hypothetical protein MP638_003103 [Amoeboaphelidium occidentale]|nr:hypothetical protein MP638_003103 [Amoeboaphelidium occidentale]